MPDIQTNEAPKLAYLLSSEAIQRCMVPKSASVIGAYEPHGFLISVVVSAGLQYRSLTVATLFRVIGEGDRLSPNSRRAEMVKVLLKSPSEDLLQMAGVVFDAAKELSNCTIIVDQGGLGTHFIKILEILGAERVIGSTWGREPEGAAHRARFFNLRAQCNVHAVEAFKDGRVFSAGDSELIEQGSKLTFKFDEYGRYAMTPKAEMEVGTDCWDTVAMAFLESATYIPRKPGKSTRTSDDEL